MSTLIGAYTFNESAANDYSGNKNHLVNTGATFSTTTTTNGGFGLDAVFAGSEYISGTFPSMAALTGFTCFFNFYTTNHDYNISTISGGYTIYLSGANKLSFTIYDSTATAHTLNSSTVLSLSTWYTVACVWDGSNMFIYINGAQDCTQVASFTNPAAGSGTIFIGTSAMHGRINMFEVRNAAMMDAQQNALTSSPGGVLFMVDTHNFLIDDLFADSNVLNQGVVTWVVDQSNFYGYSLAGNIPNNIAKYGNVYNTARQNVMEIINDFDGNGSSQISIKYPIASFLDYASPANNVTLDYRGLSGSSDSIANAMAITSLRI